MSSTVFSALNRTPLTSVKFTFLAPISIVARLLQLLKALPPMLVTLSGIVMLVRLVQPMKALPPMLITLSGIVILVRLVQPLKASSPMMVTGLPSMAAGMVNSLDAFLSQPVIVTSSSLISYFKLGLRGTSSTGLVSTTGSFILLPTPPKKQGQ